MADEHDLPVAFQTFAASLRAQTIEREKPPQPGQQQQIRTVSSRPTRGYARATIPPDPLGRPTRMSAAHPDQVWIKHIGSLHGSEKHTFAGWHALINAYRRQPAHPGA